MAWTLPALADHWNDAHSAKATLRGAQNEPSSDLKGRVPGGLIVMLRTDEILNQLNDGNRRGDQCGGENQ